jgi:hypothetical protein
MLYVTAVAVASSKSPDTSRRSFGRPGLLFCLLACCRLAASFWSPVNIDLVASDMCLEARSVDRVAFAHPLRCARHSCCCYHCMVFVRLTNHAVSDAVSPAPRYGSLALLQNLFAAVRPTIPRDNHALVRWCLWLLVILEDSLKSL